MDALSPRDAYDYLIAHPDALFVDCRTEHEHLLVGHPIIERPGAEGPDRPVNVWWADEIRGEVNEAFAADVLRAGGTHERPVVVICRSGRRSAAACEALEAAGWREVKNVLEGFEGPLDERFRRGTLGGWRRADLPWEQL